MVTLEIEHQQQAGSFHNWYEEGKYAETARRFLDLVSERLRADGVEYEVAVNPGPGRGWRSQAHVAARNLYRRGSNPELLRCYPRPGAFEVRLLVPAGYGPGPWPARDVCLWSKLASRRWPPLGDLTDKLARLLAAYRRGDAWAEEDLIGTLGGAAEPEAAASTPLRGPPLARGAGAAALPARPSSAPSGARREPLPRSAGWRGEEAHGRPCQGQLLQSPAGKQQHAATWSPAGGQLGTLRPLRQGSGARLASRTAPSLAGCEKEDRRSSAQAALRKASSAGRLALEARAGEEHGIRSLRPALQQAEQFACTFADEIRVAKDLLDTLVGIHAARTQLGAVMKEGWHALTFQAGAETALCAVLAEVQVAERWGFYLEKELRSARKLCDELIAFLGAGAPGPGPAPAGGVGQGQGPAARRAGVGQLHPQPGDKARSWSAAGLPAARPASPGPGKAVTLPLPWHAGQPGLAEQEPEAEIAPLERLDAERVLARPGAPNRSPSSPAFGRHGGPPTSGGPSWRRAGEPRKAGEPRPAQAGAAGAARGARGGGGSCEADLDPLCALLCDDQRERLLGRRGGDAASEEQQRRTGPEPSESPSSQLRRPPSAARTRGWSPVGPSGIEEAARPPRGQLEPPPPVPGQQPKLQPPGPQPQPQQQQNHQHPLDPPPHAQPQAQVQPQAQQPQSQQQQEQEQPQQQEQQPQQQEQQQPQQQQPQHQQPQPQPQLPQPQPQQDQQPQEPAQPEQLHLQQVEEEEEEWEEEEEVEQPPHLADPPPVQVQPEPLSEMEEAVREDDPPPPQQSTQLLSSSGASCFEESLQERAGSEEVYKEVAETCMTEMSVAEPEVEEERTPQRPTQEVLLLQGGADEAEAEAEAELSEEEEEGPADVGAGGPEAEEEEGGTTQPGGAEAPSKELDDWADDFED